MPADLLKEPNESIIKVLARPEKNMTMQSNIATGNERLVDAVIPRVARKISLINIRTLTKMCCKSLPKPMS